MKRIAVFVFFDIQGIVDSYISKLLSEMRTYTDRLIVVCNGGISSGEKYVQDYADEVIIRPNKGYDAGAYKDVIEKLIKTEILLEYDQLILFNDTIYGFFYPLSEMFGVIDREEVVDMWGMTEHSGIGQHKGRQLLWHLQGYFLIINKKLLHSQDFFVYWDELKYPETYTDAIFDFEIGISQYFLKKGYTLKSIYSPGKIGVPKDNSFGNLYFSHAYELVVNAGCPVLKVKSIENMSGLGVLGYLEKNNLYDSAEIWEHYRRRIRNKMVGNDTYDIDLLCDFCRKHHKIYIYGNGEIGKRIYNFLLDKGYITTGFIVTKKDKNGNAPNGVYEFEEVDIDEECGIIIGMKEQYREEVMKNVLKRIDKEHLFMPVKVKKVIIIGAGNIGKNALDFLGTDFVECFADNHKKGTDVYGKRVISVEEAVSLQNEYVLLLAVTNYAEELKKQLLTLGTKKYYYFGEALYFFDGIKQWDNRMSYEKCTLWEFYKRFGLGEAVIVGRNDKYADFISELFGIGIDENESSFYKNDKKYLLNLRPDEIERFWQKSKITNKSNVFVLPQIQHEEIKQEHKKLNVFRGKYAGKRCFIIGNGPSLKMEDLDKLNEYGDICFGLNVIHKAYANTKWRPDFICVKDPLVIAQNYEAIKASNSCPLFINDMKLFYYWDTGENEYLLHDIQKKVYFSDDIVKGCSCGASVSYTAMQVSAYMGFSEIYLLGMDCSNWGAHFNDDYWMEKEVFRAPDEIRMFDAYKAAEDYSRTHGFRIFNATRGGHLEVFERVDFDSLFGKETGNEGSGICTGKVK